MLLSMDSGFELVLAMGERNGIFVIESGRGLFKFASFVADVGKVISKADNGYCSQRLLCCFILILCAAIGS